MVTCSYLERLLETQAPLSKERAVIYKSVKSYEILFGRSNMAWNDAKEHEKGQGI